MRHHNQNRKFGRPKDQRNALMRSLAVALATHEKVTTTEAKAKELRPFFEKLITRAAKGDLYSRRMLATRLGSEKYAKKLCEEIAPRYKDRAGGYTRITKLNPRKSDASPMAVIELT